MPKVKNTQSLLAKLVGLNKKVKAKDTVVVGYTQHYAIYVHENLEAYHAPPTQAKYLSQVIRDMGDDLKAKILDWVKQRKMPLGQALYMAGLIIQAASQKIVPVDTGALRASAFTKKE